MATTFIPGHPKRWGNESTNFYQASYTPTPGQASRLKAYRCPESQYTNCGHYHIGTKSINLNPPLDTYGTPSAYKLRPVDQLVPKALTTSAVNSPMPPGPPVNLYQSHEQKYQNYSMATAPIGQSAPELGGDQAVIRSLNKAFYTTSYQSHIGHYATQRLRPKSATFLSTSSSAALQGMSSMASLCDNLDTRRKAISNTNTTAIRRARVASAPPLRPETVTMANPTPPILQRRRSFTAVRQVYPSRGEMLKNIFSAFPAPQPQEVSKKKARPSSAVNLRAGKIPSLRNQKSPYV